MTNHTNTAPATHSAPAPEWAIDTQRDDEGDVRHTGREHSGSGVELHLERLDWTTSDGKPSTITEVCIAVQLDGDHVAQLDIPLHDAVTIYHLLKDLWSDVTFREVVASGMNH